MLTFFWYTDAHSNLKQKKVIAMLQNTSVWAEYCSEGIRRQLHNNQQSMLRRKYQENVETGNSFTESQCNCWHKFLQFQDYDRMLLILIYIYTNMILEVIHVILWPLHAISQGWDPMELVINKQPPLCGRPKRSGCLKSVAMAETATNGAHNTFARKHKTVNG